MAETNRVSIPKELIPHLKAEAESLLLTDDLTAAVSWVLRKYFRDKCNATSPTANPSAKAGDLANFDDLFTT